MVGRKVGRFVLLEPIGSGGMAIVWKAQDDLLRRWAAVKILREELASLPAARRAFQREGRIAASLDHPSIVPVYEADECDGLVYLAMKWIDGETLADRIARSLLPVGEALRIAEEAGRALAYAHAQRVIHRDVTPRNIMLAARGAVCVLDFGLARVEGGSQSSWGRRGGTPAYVAPEILRGEDADQRSDIYGLGVMLYEALTGSRPFQGEVLETIDWETLNRTVDPPSHMRPELDANIDRLVLRMMARDPADRPEHVGDVLESLRGARDRMAGTASLDDRADPGAANPAPISRGAAHGPAGDRGIGPLFASRRARAYVAVLPVEIASVAEGGSEERHAPLLRGLREAMRAGLAHLDRVSVVADETVPEPDETPRAFGRRVGANLLLRSCARVAGTSIRITFSALDPEENARIAGGIVDGSSLQPLDLEDRVVAAVRKALDVEDAPDTSWRAKQRDPAAREHFEQALSFLKRVDNEASVDGAVRLLEGLLSTDGDSAAVYAALARACVRRYRQTKNRSWESRAAQSCDRARTLDPAAPEVLLALGEFHVATGRHGEALTALEPALAASPDLYEAHLARAAALDGLGRRAEAEASSRRAIELRPRDWHGHHALGLVLFRHGRYAEAIGPWQEAVALSPDNPGALRDLGTALFHLDRFEEAIDAFRRSNELRPHATTFYNLGTVLFFLERHDESVAAFERAVALSPSDPRAWGNLGNVCRWVPGLQGRMREALETAVALVRERFDREPGQAEDWARLGGWLANLGERDEAERAIRTALAMSPEDVHCMVTAGHLFVALDQREEALRWLRRAVECGYGAKALASSPELRVLRGNPEFERILEIGSRSRDVVGKKETEKEGPP